MTCLLVVFLSALLPAAAQDAPAIFDEANTFFRQANRMQANNPEAPAPCMSAPCCATSA